MCLLFSKNGNLILPFIKFMKSIDKIFNYNYNVNIILKF
jgi:hypothetical protein